MCCLLYLILFSPCYYSVKLQKLGFIDLCYVLIETGSTLILNTVLQFIVHLQGYSIIHLIVFIKFSIVKLKSFASHIWQHEGCSSKDIFHFSVFTGLIIFKFQIVFLWLMQHIHVVCIFSIR